MNCYEPVKNAEFVCVVTVLVCLLLAATDFAVFIIKNCQSSMYIQILKIQLRTILKSIILLGHIDCKDTTSTYM